MPRYCKNHSDIVAEHICHQCYQPICFNCLINFLDHKFCSIKCIFLFCGKEIGKALYGLLRLLLFALLWPFSKINKISKHVLFELLAMSFFVIGKFCNSKTTFSTTFLQFMTYFICSTKPEL